MYVVSSQGQSGERTHRVNNQQRSSVFLFGRAAYGPVAARLAGHLGKVHALGVENRVADDARLHALELLLHARFQTGIRGGVE